MQDVSPGAHCVQVSPHFFSLHDPPPPTLFDPPSSDDEDDELLEEDDEDKAEDELLEDPSSPSPLLDDKSFDGS